VREKTARVVIGEINSTVDQTLAGTGLTAKLTGAPVMQLEIRNAVERDQIVYNGLGLLFGALIAAVFFRRVSLMLVAALMARRDVVAKCSADVPASTCSSTS
jgi:predicted RND superfamily exporter protein